jgi:hypothetical protein
MSIPDAESHVAALQLLLATRLKRDRGLVSPPYFVHVMADSPGGGGVLVHADVAASYLVEMEAPTGSLCSPAILVQSARPVQPYCLRHNTVPCDGSKLSKVLYYCKHRHRHHRAWYLAHMYAMHVELKQILH